MKIVSDWPTTAFPSIERMNGVVNRLVTQNVPLTRADR